MLRMQGVPDGDWHNAKLTDADKTVLGTTVSLATLPIGAVGRAAEGTWYVYQGIDKATGLVKYVGISSREVGVRWAEHAAALGTGKENLRYVVVRGAEGLSQIGARIQEQKLIIQYGLQKHGGQLLNRVNSIAPKYWEKYGIK